MQSLTSTNTDTTPFAKRLSKARTWAQISQEGLAEILGVHKRSVANYETGKRMPPTDITVRWAAVCGIEVSYLLDAPDLTPSTQPITCVARHLHAVHWAGQAELPFPSPPDAAPCALIAA